MESLVPKLETSVVAFDPKLFFELQGEDVNEARYEYADTILRPSTIIKVYEWIRSVQARGTRVYSMTYPSELHDGQVVTARTRALNNYNDPVAELEEWFRKESPGCLYLYGIIRFRYVDIDTFEPKFGLKIRYDFK